LGSEEVQTRERILQAAFGLFVQKGYENTSVQTIIDAVGIAKGTFYHHFKGKEEMLVALVENLSRHVLAAVEPVATDPRLNAMEKLLVISQKGGTRKAQDFGPETVLLARQMRSKANRLLAESIQDIVKLWIRPLYLQVVRQGVAEGCFRVRDPEVATDLVLGTLMVMESPLLDLFLAIIEGQSTALDRLMVVYQSIEQAVERILGAPEGSLPLYTSNDIPGLLARYSQTLHSPGGTR